MVTLTEKAKDYLKSVIQSGDDYVSLGVKGGGCSGLNYFLDFVEEPRPDDQMLDCIGLTILCDPKSLLYIDEMEVDYETNLMNAGFQFRNPHAKKSCSCGESFAI